MLAKAVAFSTAAGGSARDTRPDTRSMQIYLAILPSMRRRPPRGSGAWVNEKPQRTRGTKPYTRGTKPWLSPLSNFLLITLCQLSLLLGFDGGFGSCSVSCCSESCSHWPHRSLFASVSSAPSPSPFQYSSTEKFVCRAALRRVGRSTYLRAKAATSWRSEARAGGPGRTASRSASRDGRRHARSRAGLRLLWPVRARQHDERTRGTRRGVAQ